MGNYCFVAVCSAALGASVPTEGGEGLGHFVVAVQLVECVICAFVSGVSLYFSGFCDSLSFCIWLSVPMQVTDWKDSSPRQSIMYLYGQTSLIQ